MFKKIEFIKSVWHIKDLPPPDLPEIAFLGRSNVGKSSLINRFLNRKKVARVSSTPGFTRAINFFRIDFKFYLVDLPGYGFAKVPKKMLLQWKDIIEGYLTSVRNFKNLIVIFDIRKVPDRLDHGLIEFLEYYKKPYSVVLNKIDLLSKNELKKQEKLWKKSLKTTNPPFYLISCKTGEGIEKLRKDLLKLL